MHHRPNIMANVLTYAGTLPLLAFACALLLVPIMHHDAVFFATTYSAIIISFLAGIHWACYIFFAAQCPRNLLLTSNAVALLAWLSLLVQHQPSVALLHILCFLYLFILDIRLCKAGVLPAWFYRLRRNATAIVVILLSIIMGHA